MKKAKSLKNTDVPADLSPETRELWLELVKMAPIGALSVADGKSVAIWAVAVDLHRQATKSLGEFGALVSVGAKAEPNPWLMVLNAQANIIMKVEKDLGVASWRSTSPQAAKVAAPTGKKAAARAAAENMVGKYAVPSAPKLVVSNS